MKVKVLRKFIMSPCLLRLEILLKMDSGRALYLAGGSRSTTGHSCP